MINIKNKVIFLDVGTHNGHTLKEVTKENYFFDKIYGFEPMPKQYKNVTSRYGHIENLTVFNFGLSDKTDKINIYGSNKNLGSSIYYDKNDVEKDVITVCDVVEASDFFKKNLSSDDTIIVKLNCEGAEIPILNNLVDTGEIWKISNVMIDFDIRKVKGMEQNEAIILKRFEEINFKNYCLCDNVMVGATHQKRINNWLTTIGLL